jgi:hypothetical protein
MKKISLNTLATLRAPARAGAAERSGSRLHDGAAHRPRHGRLREAEESDGAARGESVFDLLNAPRGLTLRSDKRGENRNGFSRAAEVLRVRC